MNNEISTNINKGVKLLNEALRAYEAGNNSEAFKAYTSAGKYLNEANTRSMTNDGKISMVYGGNRNFGMAYKIFESNTKALLRDKSSQKKLKEIVKLIKENKVLNNEFAIYNAFTNPTNVTNAKEYVSEAISLINQYSPRVIKENNEKLINLFKKYNLNENISVNDNEIELYENIEYILLHKKDFKNINKYNEIQNQLCEYVSENNNVITESVNFDEVYNEKINEEVAKQESLLTEDEIKLIRDTKDPVKAKKLFNENKESVISLVKEQIQKGVDVNSWTSILERLNNKVFESKTALTDIAEFIEIRNEIDS